MSKEFSFPNKGTCSKQTNFVLNDDHTIASIEVCLLYTSPSPRD